MKFIRMRPRHAVEIKKLVDASDLDKESIYGYALHARFHGQHSIVMMDQSDPSIPEGKMAGFIMGIETKKELFIWKILVAPEYRGRELGVAMLEHLYTKRGARSIQATVTLDNVASQRTFEKAFARLNLKMETPYEMFSSEVLGGHAAEYSIRGYNGI